MTWFRWGRRRGTPPEPSTDVAPDPARFYVLELYVGGDPGPLFHTRLDELARMCDLAGGRIELTTLEGGPASAGYIGCRVYRLTPYPWEVGVELAAGRPSPRRRSSAVDQPPSDPRG